MTTLLEARYRAVLRLLPSYYRQAREEEMVETYLYGIGEDEQDTMRPALGEVLSLAALGVRTRLGAAGAPPRYQALGSAVRHFALLAALLQAAAVVSERALTLAWIHRSGAEPASYQGTFGAGQIVLWWLLPLLWTAVYVALVRGRRALARVSAVAAAAPSAVYLLQGLRLGSGWIAQTAAAAALAWFTVLAVWCGFHSGRADRARLPLAAPPGLVYAATCVLMGASVVVWRQGADGDAAAGWGLAVCAALWLVMRRHRHVDDVEFAAVGLALAALGLMLLAVRVALLRTLTGAAAPGTYVTAVGVQTGVLAVAVALVGAGGGRVLAAALREK